MITWLLGENTFEIHEALKALEADFPGIAEKVDASELTVAGLPDLLMGISLFASDRLVILRDSTTNGSIWEKLPEWLPRVNETIHVVFVDTKADKRTASYKALKAVANIQEFPAWTDRDRSKAEQWLSARAKAQSVALDAALVRQLVDRVGVDQWRLAQALEVVSLLETITADTIQAVIPPNPQENIFQLFETALEGKSRAVHEQLTTLALQEDPYALFALLTSQALTLAAVTYGDDSSADPAKDFGIHPFVASKLVRHGKRLGKAKVQRIVEVVAQADADMKRSKASPWLLVEKALLHIAQ